MLSLTTFADELEREKARPACTRRRFGTDVAGGRVGESDSLRVDDGVVVRARGGCCLRDWLDSSQSDRKDK